MVAWFQLTEADRLLSYKKGRRSMCVEIGGNNVVSDGSVGGCVGEIGGEVVRKVPLLVLGKCRGRSGRRGA